MTDLIVTVNAGSSSIRCAVFELSKQTPKRLHQFHLRGLPDRCELIHHNLKSNKKQQRSVNIVQEGGLHQQGLAAIIDAVEDVCGDAAQRVAGVAHRIVHGGEDFTAATELHDDAIRRLQGLSCWAPSHQPANLAAVDALRRHYPNARHIGCFDTMFHHHQPWEARAFALPAALEQRGIRRYGFHGLSYAYIAQALAARGRRLTQAKAIVAHLGHGASMCAMDAGRSIATTMGLTPLDGLVMGARCGSLDPGVVLHLIEGEGMTPAAVRDMLYQESGMLGVSGLSSDMADLLASDQPQAARAVALFVYYCQRAVGSLAAALGGVDVVVFTGGIGEHAADVRRAICEKLSWLGLHLDVAANARGAETISTPDSSVAALVLATDEEMVLAQEAADVLKT
ncbi:MAG: acetate/propionate family kinase [Sphingomonadales bacterium]